jgi:ABC-type transport system involved in multi-copper enzyme maturation permease subunit
MDRLKEDIWGILVITKREFWSNLKSVRSVVMVILLAMIMLGASMGFSSLVGREETEKAFFSTLVALDPDGEANDLVVYVHKTGSYEPLPGVEVALIRENEEIPGYQGLTDYSGIFIASNLTPAFHHLWVNISEASAGFSMGPGFSDGGDKNSRYVYVPHNASRPGPALGIHAEVTDISGNDMLDDAVVQVLSPEGRPKEGAVVTVGEATDVTDSNGIATFERLKKGTLSVNAMAPGNLSGESDLQVTHAETEVDLFSFASQGPDEVLSLVASVAIGLFGPIYAIVLCFDAIFRERLSGSIDYLLTRPMGRRAVLLGKFIGVLLALMVPITAVSLAGVTVVSLSVDMAPTASVLVSYLFYTTLLIGIFALIQMIFSTVAKTTATAVLSGVGLWIFFFMLYNIILVVVASVSDFTNQEANDFMIRASFGNPIQLYSMAIGVSVSGELGAGLPNWSPGVAMIITFVILLLLTMEIFRKRVTE